MDRFLTQSFTVKDHPISAYNDTLKYDYVAAVAEMMHRVSHGSSKAKFMVECWLTSIIPGVDVDRLWASSPAMTQAKKAMGVRICGFRFYNMTDQFVFDCLYLAERLGKNFRKEAFVIFQSELCGFLTKHSLAKVYSHFGVGASLSSIPQHLLNHRKINNAYKGKKCKRILVVATMSAGKSTLINAMVGHRLNKSAAMACTHRLSYVYNKIHEDGVVIYGDGGKWAHSATHNTFDSDAFLHAALKFNSTLDGHKVCFIDTPGENNSRNTAHGIVTKQAIKDNKYDAVLFVSNSQYLASNDEVSLLEYTLANTDKPIVMALNQLDAYDPDDDSIDDAIATAEQMFTERGRTAIVVPVSGLAGLLAKLPENELSNVDKIELKRIKGLLNNPYYELPSYFKNRKNKHRSGLLHNSGLLDLEYIISII